MTDKKDVLAGLRWILAALAFGAAWTFFAHGMMGLRGSADFVALLVGTLGTVGIQIMYPTAIFLIHAIGVLDTALSVYFLVVCAAALRGRGKLYKLATSNISCAAFAWAALWAFLTAASRPMSEGWHYWLTHEILEFVERTSNYMVPLAAILTIVLIRKMTIRPAQKAALKK